MKIDNMKMREVEVIIKNTINKIIEFADRNPQYKETAYEIDKVISDNLFTIMVTALLFSSMKLDDDKKIEELIKGYAKSKESKNQINFKIKYDEK